MTPHSGDIIYWTGFEKGEDGRITTLISGSLIDIVLKLEDNIIGYVVIRISGAGHSNYDAFHSAYIEQSVLFPQVDGKYQNVSEEYIQKAVAMTDLINGTRYYIIN